MWAMIREETRAFKKTRIVETAARLFFELGYEATTVGRLSKELGVTKPFIYSYFNNKQEILEAVYHQSAERILVYLDEAKSKGSPDKALAEFIRLFVHENIVYQVTSGVYLQEEKHLSAETLSSVREVERTVNKKLRQLIQDGIDGGVFKVSDASMASMAVIGMIRWVHRWYHRDGKHDAEAIGQKFAEFGLDLVKYRGR